eukprot:900967-Alexandrium_andersonii.AAC.1
MVMERTKNVKVNMVRASDMRMMMAIMTVMKGRLRTRRVKGRDGGQRERGEEHEVEQDDDNDEGMPGDSSHGACMHARTGDSSCLYQRVPAEQHDSTKNKRRQEHTHIGPTTER